ncbi:MAG: very short patch repair endonuclease [Candidatus Omnitrophica bacterium]|nr:very short patch repair endonuclease [Candidatus Omnitrophota bacterium]
MDIWSKKKRSKVMSKILSCNTGPEQRVRKILSDMGYHYRLHVRDLPGKPDIVLRKYGVVIFVHGCFWHLHAGCRDGTIPKTKTVYWRKKLLRNRQRDIEHTRKLNRTGWKVLRFWECDIEKKPDKVITKLKGLLKKTSKL